MPSIQPYNFEFVINKIVLSLAYALIFVFTNVHAAEISQPTKKYQAVNLQLKWRHQFQFAGYYAAQSKGYYQAEGLKVNFVEGGRNLRTTDIVTSGQAQYGVSDSEILLDFAHGKPVVVIGAIFQHSPYILLSRYDSEIYAPSDLVGKRVMLGNNLGKNLFNAMLLHEGISPKNLKIIPHSWNLQDLIDHKVDVISAYISVEPNIMRALGVKPGIINTINYGVDFYGDNLFTTHQEVTSNPKRVAAFLRASQKGWMYALEHQEEMADLILKMPGVSERGITRQVLLNEARDMQPLILPNIIEIGHINPGRWQHIADELSNLGLMKKEIDLSDFIYQPNQPPRFFSKQNIIITIFLLAVLFFVFIAWYLKTRQKLKINNELLNKEVSRRQQVESALAASQAQVNEMFKATAAGIAIANVDGRYVMVNPAYSAMLGYTKIELKQKNFTSIIHHDDVHASVIKTQQLLDGNLASFTHEKRYIRKDGSEVWVRASVSAIRSLSGKISNIIEVTENIHEQILTNEKLKKNEFLLKEASQLAQFGGWELTLETNHLFWSDAVAIMHDMLPGEIPLLADAENMIAPEYRALVKAKLIECIKEGKPYDLEFQKITAKNRRIWVRSVGQAIRNQDGKITRIQGAFQDITNYKRLEIFNQKQSLILESIASDQPLKNVLEACVQLIEEQYPELICAINLLDESGKYLKTGASSSLPAEYSAAIDGKEIGSHAGSCGTAAFERREVIVRDIATDPLWENYKKLALKFDLQACWSWPIFSSKDVVIGTFAVYSKEISSPLEEQIELISNLAKTVGIAIEKEKVSAQVHLLESAISRLNDIVLITDAEPNADPGPTTVFVNEAFERRTGYSKAEMIGKSPRILQGPKTDQKELQRIREAIAKSQPVRAELINYKKNGEEFWLELDMVPIADSAGFYTHWVAVERDITLRKANEFERNRLNRALRLLSACNEALVRIKDEKQLIHDICKLAVDIGGYKMAWVGYASHDINQSILPVGSYGDGAGFLDQVNLSWSETLPAGMGPGGRTIRERKTIVLEEIAKDHTYPAIELVNQYGYLGLVSLPLLLHGECLGLLAMYTSEVRTISVEEVRLLEEMAEDLAYGIEGIRGRLEQEKMHTAVNKVASSVSIVVGKQFFEQLTENMIIAADADAGFIARLMSDDHLQASTLVAMVDGQVIENMTYPLDQTPCHHLLEAEHFVLSKSTTKCFPSETMTALGMKDYAGQRLVNSKGKVIGMIFVMKRQHFKQTEFTLATLKIFATRVAAEIERQDYDRHIHQQASLLDKAQDAILVRGLDYLIQFWNKGAERLYGWSEQEALGQSVVDLIYHDNRDFFELDALLLEKGECQQELRQKRKDGSDVFVDVHWTLVRDEKGHPLSVLCINTDVTQRKAAAEEIQYLAFYDSLTGLPNRLLLQDRLRHALVNSLRNNKYGAILFIDLDNFKTINDTLGHAAGDNLLKEIAKRLQENTRDSDTVSRLGGDEFIIMLEALSTDLAGAAIQTKLFSEKIIQTFELAFSFDAHKHYTTPSIGITLFKGEEQSVTELLKQADLAMYQAKAAGRNTLRFYDPQMQATVSNRVEMEADLRVAINKNEFLLHYQPQMDADGRCIGAEALLRWNSKAKGMISPNNFIPLAEETLLILPIGEWVLKTACEALVKWAKIPQLAHLQLAVNVSVHQFRMANFVDVVLNIIKSTGVNPTKLKLELTESLFVENVEDIITKMSLLKERGVSFSLDDFGTGYSSLSYLKRLPLDQLKIDQSFVRDVLIDSHDATIAKSIITLGKSLGFEVIAEGVELLEQQNFLLNEGCYLYQGYYFSKPLPLEGLEDFVKSKASVTFH